MKFTNHSHHQFDSQICVMSYTTNGNWVTKTHQHMNEEEVEVGVCPSLFRFFLLVVLF